MISYYTGKESGLPLSPRKENSWKEVRKPSTVLLQYGIWRLPVGSFITETLSKEVPDTARVLLESNVKDEERHDLALGYVADVHGLDAKAEKEAKLLRDAWIATLTTLY